MAEDRGLKMFCAKHVIVWNLGVGHICSTVKGATGSSMPEII